MKKFIALSITASMLMSSSMAFADLSPKQISTDAISAATSYSGETPSTPTKPVTPTKVSPTPPKTKSTPVTPTKAVTPTPPKVVTPVVTQTKPVYVDGVYVTWGNAYNKGTEGAKVTIKNGKVADLLLIRSNQKMIDNNPSSNYSGVWLAYKPMTERLLGKTREEAAKVDTISGATRSSQGWKLSVDRAFQRALKTKPAGQTYFAGEHMGVDPEGKYMVFAKYDTTKLIGVKAYVFGPNGSIIEDPKALSPSQATALAVGLGELSYNGKNAKPVVGFEKDNQALFAAFADAQKNASINYQSKYIDGFYSAYSEGRSNGIERTDLIIRNDKLVDIKLYRLGADLKDRGNTAYPAVVTANLPMVQKLLSNGEPIAYYNAALDGISGATESSKGWNEAAKHAFQKALRNPLKTSTFDGTFLGVDNLSTFQLVGTFKNGKVEDLKVNYLKAGKVLADANLTPEQIADRTLFVNTLLKEGVIKPIEGKTLAVDAVNKAYADLLTNASTKQLNYKDGTYTTYGHTYDKGTNQAIVTLRNGKVVDLKMARLGQNFIDRGASAYPEVVKLLPQFLADFLAAGTRENIAKVDVATVDATTGATATGDGLKHAIEYAYLKAEINENPKTAFINDIFPGIDKKASVYVMTTVKNDIPTLVQVYFLTPEGKVIADNDLTSDQIAIKKAYQLPDSGALYKYAYRATPIGENDNQKSLSASILEAITLSLANASK